MAVVEQQGTKSNSPTLPLRLLVVTRKYWPVVDEACMRLMHWIDHWKSLGIDVQIVTARWNKAWPSQANLRGAQVHRLVPPPTHNGTRELFSAVLPHGFTSMLHPLTLSTSMLPTDCSRPSSRNARTFSCLRSLVSQATFS